MWRRAGVCRAARCAGDKRPALPVPVLMARMGSCTARSRRRLSKPAALAPAGCRSPWLGEPRSVTGCPPAVLCCAEAGLLAWKKRRLRATNDWTFGGDERVERSAQAGQQMLRHWDEGGMVTHHGCQHLFGDIRSAEKAEPEAGPARDPQLHLLQMGCVEGCGGGVGLLGQRNAQVLHARPLCCEGDSCGGIWTSKVA